MEEPQVVQEQVGDLSGEPKHQEEGRVVLLSTLWAIDPLLLRVHVDTPTKLVTGVTE